MKNLSLLLFAFLFLQFTSLAQQGWFWQNPLPQGNTLNDVWAFDQHKAIAVGEAGTMLKSIDGGINWEIVNIGFNQRLKAICFVDNNIGWIAGQCGVVFRTTDGGDNWYLVKSDTSCGTYNIISMQFIDINTGWILEYNGQSGGPWLYKTTDGGSTWSLQQYPNISQFVTAYDIYFIDSMHGWIATTSSDSILCTTTGGENWFTQYVGGNGFGNFFKKIFFVNEYVGWIGSNDGYGNLLFKTTDGGMSWEEQIVDSAHNSYCITSSICFVDEQKGWIVINESWGECIIYSTTDGGETWINQYETQYTTVSSIKFIDHNIGWGVGGNGEIVKTTTGGNDWTSELMGYTTDLNDIFFNDENTGWAVGRFYSPGKSAEQIGQEIILKTTNGGNDWDVKFIVNQDATWLNSVFFVNNNLGWAAGNTYSNGSIIKTTNGGDNWEIQSNESFNFQDVFFIDEDRGWAVGESTILKTSNGGSEWVSVLSGLNVSLNSIWFITKSRGFAVGYDGQNSIILRSQNGGDNWSIISSGTTEILNSIFFANPTTGWIVGSGGTILKTIDGGNHWGIIYYPNPINFTSVYFTDFDNGWISGHQWQQSTNNEKSVVLHSSNGGYDWIEQNVSANNVLNSIFFVDETTGWVAGYNGLIMKTTNGGVSFVEENEIDEMPTEYSLSYNYPNPFNPSTKIKYSVPQTSSVVIKVFDILGSEIETLVNEEKPAGTYEITWSAEELPSGVYFYQLKAVGHSTGSGQGFIETKKMLLLK